MRPAVPDLLPPRPRKSSLSLDHPIPPWCDPSNIGHNQLPTTFFLAREHDHNHSHNHNRDNDQDVFHPDHQDNQDHCDAYDDDLDSPCDSMFGVRSLEATVHSLDPVSPKTTSLSPSNPVPSLVPGLNDENTSDNRQPVQHHQNNNSSSGNSSNSNNSNERFRSTRRGTVLPLQYDGKMTPPPVRASPDISLSRPLTPLGSAPPDEPPSLPSTPKSTSTRSFKPLDDVSHTDEFGTNQVIVSGDDADDDPTESPGLVDSSSQLIMPSIRMPSRRPFTERGKRISRFKVLVAGANGSGKSSLIRSIVQACDDIVHVDPMPVPSSGRPGSKSGASHTRRGSGGSPVPIAEIYASTKPYPSWWSDLDNSRVLRRRKSYGDAILERNLCFVDTLQGTGSRAAQTQVIAHYMGQQWLRAMTAVNAANFDLEGMLGGDGGSQVDAVLYLVSEDTLAADIDCIQNLCELSNVIPLIAKADLLSASQISALKKSFTVDSRKAGIKPFLFGDMPSSGERDDYVSQPPFAVSSAHSNDDDNMDASALMSPDYVQPLVQSELKLLIENMFDQDNLAWLRHSSARKLVKNRDAFVSSTVPSLSSMARPSSSGLSAGATALQVLTSYPADGATSGYTMARLADYTQSEEKLAQVRLAKWAADLQRSLQNERTRYAALAQGERAIWLTERLGECVVDGTLIPITQTPGFSGLRVSAEKDSGTILVHTGGSSGPYRIAAGLNSSQDPLGLVRWSDDLRRRGWIIVQVVGSFGVVGGLALWLAKIWGLPSQTLSEWRFQWFSGD